MQIDTPKPKKKIHSPSVAAGDDSGKEECNIPLMSDSDVCSEDDVALDEVSETDDSKCEDTMNDNDESLNGEMPVMGDIDPVNPVDGIQGAESIDDSPIYPNARITNAVSMLLIMTFALTHKLSGVAIRDLLSLIDIHCLVPNPLLKSLFKFKQYFQSLKSPLKNITSVQSAPYL